MRKFFLIYERYKPLFAVGVILLIVSFIIFIVNILTFFDTLNPTKQILIAALISTIFALIISYIGIKADARIQYFDDLEGLIEEMQTNYENICNFPKLIEKNCIAWGKNGNWNWIPKESSYSNWGDGENFHLKYCKSSAYFNFVNKGHIIHNYMPIPTESIAHFYQFCIRFSIQLQKIENQIITQRNSTVTSYSIALVSNESSTTSGHIVTVSDNPMNHTQEDGNIIRIGIDDKPYAFNSKKEVCDFLKNDFYLSFAEKNNLNKGIKGEYESMREYFKKYFDLKSKNRTLMTRHSHLQFLEYEIKRLINPINIALLIAFVGGILCIISGLVIISNINYLTSLAGIGNLAWTWAFFFVTFGFSILICATNGLNSVKSERNNQQINKKMDEILEMMKNRCPPPQ